MFRILEKYPAWPPGNFSVPLSLSPQKHKLCLNSVPFGVMMLIKLSLYGRGCDRLQGHEEELDSCSFQLGEETQHQKSL